jgi:arabinogalactan oligomer/maltooligosaccharide transport system permease protein
VRIFKGSVIAVATKIILVTLAMTALGYFAFLSWGTGDTNISIFLMACILLLAFGYFTNLSIPVKFFAPGLMFLVAFVVVPVVFTISMSGFKYQTGNMLSKEVAVQTIVDQGTESDPDGTAFDAVLGYYGDKIDNTAIIVSQAKEETITSDKPGVSFSGVLGYYNGDKENIAVLASDSWGQTKYSFFIATKDEFIDLKANQVTLDEWGEVALKTANFTPLTKSEVADVAGTFGSVKLKYEGLSFIVIDTLPVKGIAQVSVREVSQNMTYSYFIATKDKWIKVNPKDVTTNTQGVALTAKNFTAYSNTQVGDYADKIGNARLKYKDPYFIRIDSLPSGGFAYATVNIQNLVYDKKADTITSVLSGVVYQDDGRGNYRNPNDKTDYLDPGWKQGIWFENFTNLFSDPKVREPLIAVFIWTISFAILTVFTQFALGLLVALAMDKKIRGRGIYRSLMILPYAMPSIMSILIWGGMLDDNGAINGIFDTHIIWLHDPIMAKVSVLLVNLWLGFPYFYLISSGSLQAIPKELAESASIDGAHPRQIFRLITLPLLLRMLAPLLIASFAFNFNNFNIIYLLTGGGPAFEFGSIAGHTDILISYTYKIAFGQETQNYGLASAISVVIFFIVAGISMYGIRKSKVLDDFA